MFQEILSNFGFLHDPNAPSPPANCRPPARLVGWGYFRLWIWMLPIASSNIPSATYVLSRINLSCSKWPPKFECEIMFQKHTPCEEGDS